jgi:hypothetical protein
MAGATTVVPGSPRPAGASVLSMNSISSLRQVADAQRRIGVEIGVLHLAI